MKWNADRFYEGYWKDNVFSGKGKLHQNNKLFIGFFEKGKKNGKGIVIYPGGKYIAAYFIDGKVEGSTIKFDKSISAGTTKNNVFTSISNNNDSKLSIEYSSLIEFVKQNLEDY